jgi:dephospho-CoA kinase
MKIIGLTGPAAAGKNEVARIWRRRGALVIDADKVAHELYATQSPVWHQLIKAFGSKILMRGGKIDRQKLGEIVFADKTKLRLLNKLVHPALKALIMERLATSDLPAGRQDPRHETVVINAAVLKEIGLLGVVDQVWVVTAPRDTRFRRLLKRGLDRAEANRLIHSQPPQKAYLRIADTVINNKGTRRQLAALVRRNLALSF